jgi:probable rRNA maturation factor
LTDAGYQAASISLVVVDDPTIHDLNRRYLDHDYPTDVLSFPLEDRGDYLEGEVVASADTAAREALNQGCTAADELTLYIIHGLLHLVGYRDKSAEEASRMRAAEKHYLNQAGIEPALSHKSRAGERTS